MGTLTTSKRLAGFGSILVFFGFFSTTIFTLFIHTHGLFFFILHGHMLSISGMILGFIGMKGLAKYYRDTRIHKETRTSIFFGITSFITLLMWPFALSLFEYWILTRLLHNSYRPGWVYTNVMPALMFVIVFAFMFLTALTFRKALNILTIQTGKQLFRIAGTILLIGTILAFMFFIGVAVDTTLCVMLQSWPSFFSWLPLEFPTLILVWIPFLMLTIAFFTLKTNLNTPQSSYSS